MQVHELLRVLHERGLLLQVLGTTEGAALRPHSLTSAGPGSVCFSQSPTPEIFEQAAQRGTALLLSAPFEFPWREDMPIAVCDRVRLAFAVVTGLFEPPPVPGVHPTAVVDGYVDPSSTVGAMCYVGPGCSVGAGSVLHPGVVLVRNVRVGERCIVHSGAVLGADGFGYARDQDGRLEKIRHFGGVVLEDHVDIGPNSNVNAGTLDPTRLCFGAKVDALCHIGHNAQIGRHAALAAGTILGRSALGEASWTGLNSTILPGNDVGDRGTVAAHALVTREVPPDTTAVGVPARAISRVRKPGDMW